MIDHNITDASGHNFDYYFGIDESKAFLNQNGQVQGIAFYSKSGNPISKNTWQWFWRNAIYYVCYDGKSDLGDQVYFYIDEQDLQNVNASFGANNAQNPYSEWTAPIEGTYEITLYLGGYAVWVNDNAANGNTLTVKTVTNMYGEQVQNYSLNYVQNILKIHPLSITIIPDDKEMVYGTANEPALTYTLEGRRVKWDDLSDVKLVRDAGRDVYDGYVIRVDSYNNSDNYMVDVETGIFKITPAYLMVTPDHHTKYYGDPAPDWSIGITGFKYDDTVDSVFVDGRNAGRVVDDGFDYIKASVGDYTFNVDETSLEMIPNQFGNYNYVITQNPSSLRIIPRPITIEAGGWSKPYGTPDPEHTVLITDDLTGKTGTSGTDPNVCVDPENAPITFDLSRADGEEVGVYPIYVSAAEKELGHDPGCHGEIDGLNTNYTITYIPDNDIIYRADELIGMRLLWPISVRVARPMAT